MKRTLNEVYRLCQKAAEGAATPAGLDMEAAQSAVWLLARDLPALKGLAVALERLEQEGQTQSCQIDAAVPASTSAHLDARGKAGALLVQALVDLLVARVGDQETRFVVQGLSAPLYLLPAAARYVNDNHIFRFVLSGSSAERFEFIVDRNGVSIFGSAGADVGELANDAEFDVIASCMMQADTALNQTAQLVALVTNDTLTEAKARNLAEGVEILESEPWQRLQSYAVKVLVPATEASRQRGAGADLKDNE